MARHAGARARPDPAPRRRHRPSRARAPGPDGVARLRASRSARRARTSPRSRSCSSTTADGRRRSTGTSSTCRPRRDVHSCGRSRWASRPRITPWNYPMMMAVQKVAPAIAAGCTFILKPAEQTPLTALEIPEDPRGGRAPARGAPRADRVRRDARARRSSQSPKVDKVGFTGSSEVGKIIMRTGADTLKRVTLELGGKSPNIVFADADSRDRLRGVGERRLLEPGRDLLGGHARVRRAADLRRRA